jgi:Ca2+-binding EF-hand superfamily protein
VVWRLFDLDGDGGLDAAEAIPFLSDYVPSAFEMLDLDHNQRLTPNEVLWDGYRGRVSPLLPRYDFNHNWVLEANELALDTADPRFAFMDANANGTFDCEDITLLSTQPGSLPAPCHGVTLLLERYASTDVDHDNTLSVAEAMTGLGDALAPEVDGAAIVAYIDADSDGYLSVLELKEAGGLCLWAGPDAQLRPCKLPIDIHALLEIAWPILDRNADLHLSLAEIQQFEPAFAQWMFNLGDANRDGLVSVRELIPVLPLLPVPLFRRLEENNNRLLEYFEVQHILDFAAFQAIDSNGNQLLDCGDRPAPRGLVSLWKLCPEWEVLNTNFAEYDVDENGALSLAEVLPRDWDQRFSGVDIVGLYAMVDLDGNGGLSEEELAQVLSQTCVETDELAVPANLRLRRHAGGNNTFLPDSRLRVTLLLDELGLGQAEAVQITETLPAGWRIAAVMASAGADTLPEVQAEGNVSFAWSTPPVLPATVVYEVDVPATASGDVDFFGQVTWRNAVDGPEQSAARSTTVGLGEGAASTHTVDQNQDWRISLSEMLRLIQLHNAGSFHCAPNTEDLYAPGPGNQDCLRHASDYRPGNWAIDLGELLRVIQFYNMEFSAYHRSASTEDGFAAGVYIP